MNVLNLIGRDQELFSQDIANYDTELVDIIQTSKFLVLGGAGSIGQAVTKEIFKRNPTKLHVVDISENNLVELGGDLRSFSSKRLPWTSALKKYNALINANDDYNYALNLKNSIKTK